MDEPQLGPTQSNLSERAIDSLTDARRAVLTASKEVAEVTDHFRDAVRDRPPNPFADLLRDCTRSAPLTMLGLAFAAGVMLARR